MVDLQASRDLLENCIANTQTLKQRNRAELIEKAFQYYEATALAYLGDRQIFSIDTEEDALAAVDLAERATSMAAKRRTLVFEEFPSDPVLVHPHAYDLYPSYLGEVWGQDGFWTAVEWARAPTNAVSQRLQELATTSECEDVRTVANMVLKFAEEPLPPSLLLNPSFESATNWHYWNKVNPATDRTAGVVKRSNERSRTGGYSGLCASIYRGGPNQTIQNVSPGEYAATAWVYVADEVPSGSVQLNLVPIKSDGESFPSYHISHRVSPGVWTPLSVGGVCPEGTASIRLVLIADGYETGGKVYWDDASLYRLDEPPSE